MLNIMDNNLIKRFRITLDNDWYEDWYSRNMYGLTDIELHEGITTLVGCNGSGKTTFIKQLKHILEEKEIVFLDYNNLGMEQKALSKAGFIGDWTKVANTIQSSEGENIYDNFGFFLRTLGTKVRKMNSGNKFFIFVDGIDSGLSIDLIEEMKDVFRNVILPDLKKRGIEAYIIITANSYELVENTKCFSLMLGKYVRFEDYNDYKTYIMETKEYKNNRIDKNKKENDNDE